MSSPSVRTILLSTALLTFASACSSPLGAGILDGRLYRVDLVKSGESSGDPDQLVFDGGLFDSVACRQYGFQLASYTARSDGDALHFEATAKSSEQGTNAWSGRIEGDRIEGTLHWTNASGETTDFHFSGSTSTGSLDGRSYAVRLDEEGGGGDDDLLVFRTGCLDSQSCRPYGFPMSTYTTSAEGDAVRFEAEARNCAGESNLWKGVVAGEQIEGTMEHRAASGRTLATYRFSGSGTNAQPASN